MWERQPAPKHPSKMLKHAYTSGGGSSSQIELVSENLKWLKWLSVSQCEKSLLPFCCAPPAACWHAASGGPKLLQRGGFLFVEGAVFYLLPWVFGVCFVSFYFFTVAQRLSFYRKLKRFIPPDRSCVCRFVWPFSEEAVLLLPN